MLSLDLGIVLSGSGGPAWPEVGFALRGGRVRENLALRQGLGDRAEARES